MNENNNYDLSSIVANIEKVKAMKAAKAKKPSVSIKPLNFEENPDDSPLKAEIIKQINARNLQYKDIYEYCTKVKNGDINEGQKLGYNIISGLKNRRSMLDGTFSMLCDWLELDIMLVPRKKPEPVDDIDEIED